MNENELMLLGESLDYINESDRKIVSINDKINLINDILTNINIDINIDKFDTEITNKIRLRLIKEKRSRLLDLICNTKFDIVTSLNKGLITAYDLILVSGEYLKIMVRKDINYIPYYKNLVTIDNPYESFMSIGLSIDVINDINISFGKILIDNKFMYNRDGILYYSYTFLGLLAMFGFKLSCKKIDDFSGFFIGNPNKRLNGLNKENIYDYICRCVGFNTTKYSLKDKYKYAGYDNDESIYVDGYIKRITPRNEINVDINSNYFTNAKLGDILHNDYDIKLILSNDKVGYYVLESNPNLGGVVINYYPYSRLVNYSITNMVSFYENVTRCKYDSNPRSSNFIPISVFISSLNLPNSYKKKLAHEYNVMNKNPNDFNNPIYDEDKVIELEGDITSINFAKLSNTIKLMPVVDRNILPENKFSKALPAVWKGNITNMDINNNSVNYEIVNINSDIYHGYENKLKSLGYAYSDGAWINDKYKVVTELSSDETKMSLGLFELK